MKANDRTERLRRTLDELRVAYTRQLPQRVAQMEAAWTEGLALGWDSEKATELRLIAHSLKGSAATYGFPEVSEAAAGLETTLVKLLEADGVDGGEAAAAIRDRLEALRAAVAGGVSDGAAHSGMETIPIAMRTRMAASTRARLVYIVDDDLDFGDYLAEYIAHYGYKVRVMTTVRELMDAVADRRPAAIVLDMVMAEGPYAGSEAAKRLNADRHRQIPILFVSVRTDIQSRLEAVRGGAKGYFTKPVDMGELVAHLDEVTALVSPAPYRVLIVDDDMHAAEYHSAALQAAGMETLIITDPLAVMQPLADFSADLLLLDMHMPHCTGMELAEVIRHQPAYSGLPIVFLSAEHDRDLQMSAVSRGADDFITKPVPPDRLISSVLARAERLRLLRMLGTQDAMTRLLNHTAIKDRLDSELARAVRASRSVAFALLDLDHFKQVNDTYGHLAGDAVIKNLARLLRQRLRRSDAIGRYGGEEFAIVLPETAIDEAFRLIDALRADFGQMQQGSGAEVFNTTFSCGLAVFPSLSDVDTFQPQAMIAAADEALYSAKRRGRDQVVISGREAAA